MSVDQKMSKELKLSKRLCWQLAIRPKTLTAAVVPIICATSLAKADTGKMQFLPFFFALLFALLVQVGTNLFNDLLDFKRGADTALRLGPARAVQMGLLSANEVMFAALFCFFLATLVATPLVILGGFPFFLILVFSLLFGYLYTGGPFPLAYCGLGEVFVLLFFGFVATVSLYYLHSGRMALAPFLLGAQLGTLSCAMLAINNLRDIDEDRLSQKRTLAVRFGKLFSRIEITCFLLLPFFLNFFWKIHGYLLAPSLTFLSLPFGLKVIHTIWNVDPSHAYNKALAQASLLLLTFGSTFAFGLFLEKFS